MGKKQNTEEEDGAARSKSKLSKAQILTIGVTIVVVFIGAGLTVLVREWYSPDLRYTVNPYYRLSNSVVASCYVKNFGHDPANEVRIDLAFSSQILDIQITPQSIGSIAEGGIGKNNAVVTVPVLVPRDDLTIFVSTETEQTDPFVKHIASKEVLGRTGAPTEWWAFMITALAGISFGIVTYRIIRKLRVALR